MPRLKIDTVGHASSYECEDMDAGLPLHAHMPGSGLEHNIRCDAGRVLVFILPQRAHILSPGEVLEFDSTQWHGLMPLEPCTRFTNTSRIEQEEFHSVLDQGHNAPEWVQRFINAILNAQTI